MIDLFLAKYFQIKPSYTIWVLIDVTELLGLPLNELENISQKKNLCKYGSDAGQWGSDRNYQRVRLG